MGSLFCADEKMEQMRVPRQLAGVLKGDSEKHKGLGFDCLGRKRPTPERYVQFPHNWFPNDRKEIS